MVKKTVANVAKYVLLIVYLGFILLPICWTLMSSLKDTGDMFTYPPVPYPKYPTLDNYKELFAEGKFQKAFLNTLFIATTYTVLNLFFCSLAGFAFAKYEFPGKRVLFGILLATMLVPIQVVVIPLFMLMVNIGWLDTYQAVIVPFTANAFGIFLVRQYMFSIPTELIESAHIDGCSNFRIYWKIALPVSKPILFTLGLLQFLQAWNDFLWPLIILEDKQVLSVFISGLVGIHITDYGHIMAASSMAILPVIIVYLLTQKYFIAGAFAGAVKG